MLQNRFTTETGTVPEQERPFSDEFKPGFKPVVNRSMDGTAPAGWHGHKEHTQWRGRALPGRCRPPRGSTQPRERIGGLEPAPGTPRSGRALLATAAAGDDSRQQRPGCQPVSCRPPMKSTVTPTCRRSGVCSCARRQSLLHEVCPQ